MWNFQTYSVLVRIVRKFHILSTPGLLYIYIVNIDFLKWWVPQNHPCLKGSSTINIPFFEVTLIFPETFCSANTGPQVLEKPKPWLQRFLPQVV